MRFKSNLVNGYRVFAVSGTNTISLAIDASTADTGGLLGFAVERVDPAKNQRFFMRGFKVFPSVIPHPTAHTVASTFEHPVQSFVWDDFTAEPGHAYTYLFHPLKGTPGNLDRSAPPIQIDSRTETLFDPQAVHQVFFNRGVASSQAYVREFSNKRPDELDPVERDRALQWLSRELDEAMLAFIASAAPGDTLLGCFYEFRYLPVAQALADAAARGVQVRLIVDAKNNAHTDNKGVFHESFPREENLAMINKAGLPDPTIILRQARTSAIAHNKFMVLLRGPQQTPSQVRAKNKQFRQNVEALLPTPVDWRLLPAGITPVFSPRTDNEVLKMYAKMVDEADDLSCITLAFGINKEFKEQLKDNTPSSHIAFFLLEKKDAPNPQSTQPFIAINLKQNVYKAWGSYNKR